MKCASPRAPVDVQVLGQERGDDQPRAVVHPARRGASWRIAGVDERDSRCGPRARRRSARRRPSHSSASNCALVGVARRCPGGAAARARRSRARRAGARTRRARAAASRARASSSRARDAAEVQVRARAATCRPRAGRGARRSASMPSREPARAARSRAARLAGRERLARPPARARRRELARRRGRPGRAACAARRGSRAAAAAATRARTGVKTAYGLPAFVAAADVGDEVARACGARSTPPPSSAASTRRSRAIANGETSRGEVDGARRRVSRASAGSSLLRPARAHDEVAAALAQRVAQLAQAARAGTRARLRGREAPARAAVVEHEHAARRARRVRRAARSGGWSWTRRSRRNQTSAVAHHARSTAHGAPRT